MNQRAFFGLALIFALGGGLPARADNSVDAYINCINSIAKYSAGSGSLVQGRGKRVSFVLPTAQAGTPGFYFYVGKLTYGEKFAEIPGGRFFCDSTGVLPGNKIALTFPDVGNRYRSAGFERQSDRTVYKESSGWTSKPSSTVESKQIPESYKPPLQKVYKMPTCDGPIADLAAGKLKEETLLRLKSISSNPSIVAKVKKDPDLYLMMSCGAITDKDVLAANDEIVKQLTRSAAAKGVPIGVPSPGALPR